MLAHVIREPSKSFAKSICALQAERRWAVTGTPIQNRLADLFSLFKFLRCSPFDDQKVFNTQVAQNWKKRSDPDSVAKLKTLVNCLALRRPKTTIELLPRTDETVFLNFSKEEQEDYQRVKNRTLHNLGNVGAESGGTQFLNTLKWVNELRLMCIHGVRDTEKTQRTEKAPPVWSVQEAQVCFDQLDGVGLAKCSNQTQRVVKIFPLLYRVRRMQNTRTNPGSVSRWSFGVRYVSRVKANQTSKRSRSVITSRGVVRNRVRQRKRATLRRQVCWLQRTITYCRQK